MSSQSAEETDYTMDSLTWDSSFKAKLRSRAAIKVSLKPVCGGGGGQGHDEGKGVPGDKHRHNEAAAKQEGVLGHLGSWDQQDVNAYAPSASQSLAFQRKQVYRRIKTG